MAVQSLKDVQVFKGVMDADSQGRFVPEGNYRKLLNARTVITDGQNYGAVEDTLGNILIPNTFLPSGRNKCIGTFEDVKGNSIIYCVFNSLGYHSIFRYYFSTIQNPNGEIQVVYQVRYPFLYGTANPPPLNFSEFKLITGIELVDDLFFITDDSEEPKCINVARANNTNKNFSFELYINPADIASPITYTINLYRLGILAPVYTIVVNSTALTISDRVKDIIAAFDADINFPVYLYYENKGQYIVLTSLNKGECFMNIISTSVTPNIKQSIILPGNHYADYLLGAGASFPPLTLDVFKQVKYPPFCAPEVEFDGSAVYYPGEFFAIGNSNWVNVNLAPADSYFVVTIGSQYAFTINIQFSVTIWGPGSSLTFELSDGTIFYDHALGANTTGVFNLTFNINPFVVPFSTNLYMAIVGVSVQCQVTDGYWIADNLPSGTQEFYVHIVDSAPRNFTLIPTGYSFGFDLGTQANLVNYSISSKSLLFRAKYIFLDYEQSVYGAISEMPLAKSIYNQFIFIDYDDKWLTDLNYLSTIKKVRLAVSEDNGVTWGDFVELDRYEFATLGSRFYNYFGNELFLAVAPSTSLLPFHSVPLRAESMAYIGERIWLGSITEGYDSITPNVLATVKYTNVLNTTYYNFVPFVSTRGFRYGYKGYLGIVYYDNADRKSGVCVTSQRPFSVPYLYENNFFNELDTEAFVPYVELEINHEPPAWATKYQIVITQDATVNDYLVFFPAQVNKVDDQFVEVFLNPVYWEIDMSSIAHYITKSNIGTEISYTFKKGDRLRVIAELDGTIFKTQYDYEILSTTGDKLYIQYQTGTPFELGAFVSNGANCWIEIYSERDEADDLQQTYFEIGSCYEVETILTNGLLKKRHKGSSQDQNYGGTPLNIITPAIVQIDNGGCYYRRRDQYYNIQPAVTFTKGQPGYIYSNTPNEYRADIYNGFGRANFIATIGQISRPTAHKFTNRYISGTEINGLCAIEPANDRQYDTTFGAMRKMIVLNNDVLRLIFETRQMSIYVNQGLIRQAQGANPIVSVIDDVAANSHIVERTYGTNNPESVVVNDEGDMMGFDETEGAVYRSSSNGLIAISDNYQKTTFNQAALDRRYLDRAKSECPAVYDLYHDEYILTIGALQPKPEVFPSVTISVFDVDIPSPGQVTNVFLRLQPSGILLGSTGPVLGSIIDAINIVFTNLGYTTVKNPNGTLTVTSLDAIDSLQNLIVDVRYQDSPDAIVESKYYAFPFGQYEPGGDQTPFTPYTIAYSKQKKGWTQYYSFTPEFYGRLRNEIVSFQNGELWLHNRGLAKNFYGVQYGRELTVISNVNFPKLKNYKAISINGIGLNNVPLLKIPPYQGIPTGMESELTAGHFSVKEGIQYAAIQRDKLTPNATTPDEGWVNGRAMVGQQLEATIVNNDSTVSVIYSVEILYFSSENS
jgi:hypothetical protein